MGTGRSGLSKGIKNTTKQVYKTWSSQRGSEQDLQIDIDKWNKAKSKAAHDALYRYTGSFYMTSNKVLRDSQNTGKSVDEVMKNVVSKGDSSFVDWLKNMDKGLDAYNNTTAFIGYRGAGYSLLGGKKSFDEIKAMVGKTVHDAGHMSISTVSGHEFDGSVLYEVKVPKGKGIGAYVGQLSQHRSEAEFLLNRGTVFKIVKVRQESGQPVVTLEVYGRY
jgi:predicted phage gp36 major capsid-like protein